MARLTLDTLCSVSRPKAFVCSRRECYERAAVRLDHTKADECAFHGGRSLAAQIREALKMRYSFELLRLLAQHRGVAV